MRLFLLGQFLDFESRVSKGSIKNPATDIFTVDIALVCQLHHMVHQIQGRSDIFITGFHAM